jgi:hypothetical protein
MQPRSGKISLPGLQQWLKNGSSDRRFDSYFGYRRAWQDIVQDFSSRSLSKSTGKHSALSGLARSILWELRHSDLPSYEKLKGSLLETMKNMSQECGRETLFVA